jgi:hypothetical protein
MLIFTTSELEAERERFKNQNSQQAQIFDRLGEDEDGTESSEYQAVSGSDEEDTVGHASHYWNEKIHLRYVNL